MHLFYRILCLIQFVQIRAARHYNYGLDKEIVLQKQNPTLKWHLLEKNCTYSFIHSFMQQALTEHLFHPHHCAWCWEHKGEAQPGRGDRHLNRWS